jgi:hypothetical protein
MPRGARPGERRGGRAKGTTNKRTVEAEAYFRTILESDDFQHLLDKVLHAEVPSLTFMQTVWAYVYGKPIDVKQVLEITKVDEHGNRTTQVLEI